MNDTRMVPVALVVWAIATVGLAWGWQFSWLLGGIAVVTAFVVAVRSLRWRPQAVLVIALGALATCWIAMVIHTSATHPLRSDADHGATVTLRVEVSERPKPLRTQGFGSRQGGADRVLVPAGDVIVLAQAAGWADLLPGQWLTVTGRAAPARTGDLTVAVVQARGSPTEVTPAPPWQKVAATLRNGLRRATSVLPDEQAGLVPGLIVGDTANLSPRVSDEFKVAGMTHLLAVSGANLAIIAGTVLFAIRLLGMGPRIAGVGAGLAVIGFVILAGPEPSVLRAAVMGGLVLLALVLGRERSLLPALAWSVVVLVPIDPSLGLSAGFTLSVLATGALVLVAPRWAVWLRGRGVPPGVAEAVAAPLAAHLVTAPVIAGLSGEVSVVAVVANLAAEPVVAPATVIGVLATMVTPMNQWLGEMLARATSPEAWWLIHVARYTSSMPLATVRWPSGLLGAALLAAVMVVGWAALRSRRLRVVAMVVVVGAVLVLMPARLTGSGWPPTGWAMVSCDVGQGDAHVLATSQPGRVVLIDTGPDLSSIVGCLHRLGVVSIPLIVLSHLHADHVGGLSSVLSDYPVGAVGVGPLHEPAWAWDQVRRQASDAGVQVVDIVAGQRFELPGVNMTVIAPQEAPSHLGPNAEGTPVNDASLVVRADTAAGRILLTGDIELEGQANLLATNEDLSADVLKVPHHGSRYSLPRFLERVHPRVAMVSVGAGNPFGHPSSLILDALKGEGATVLRTDEDGDVAIIASRDGPLIARRGSPRVVH
ncbi:DNA internalization-related competence protein ComEC/Rec2 [Kutzneria sp. 744]|uniref:DNA internalization-related competence protein ComEC/Rec2 n=1 Tax=Kutzneria sp. (strain 744) TaxID=345341 RepID=UPI0003EEC3AE|nr:DNA internalization-related competence protein ComEC/Rec2 [Kutzneria sp. 744]EWM13015.1 DNA internalization-related competence protein ComEC/Rec2 [Kutzneria sp. 744]